MAVPSTPSQHAETIARQLRAVDLSGGASTADRHSNSARAVASAFTPLNTGGNLLAAYAAWKARQAELDAAGIGRPLDATARKLDVTADDVRRVRTKHARAAARHLAKARREALLAGPALEDHAMRKARKAYRKHLPAGREPAVHRAHVKYQKAGGKLGLAAFRRRLGA